MALDIPRPHLFNIHGFMVISKCVALLPMFYYWSQIRSQIRILPTEVQVSSLTVSAAFIGRLGSSMEWASRSVVCAGGGVYRRVQTCGGVYRRVQACGGVYRRVQACGGNPLIMAGSMCRRR